MTYRPREFWEERLRGQFDLRGTGETGLSLAYNQACYDLRRHVLDRALREAGFDPRGRSVLDVGCGTGFFTSYYLERGADVTGLDLTAASVENLSRRFPAARFVQADVSDTSLGRTFDLVNAFDVLYHVTDDTRWERAVGNLARAVAPGGIFLVTDLFAERPGLAEHNVTRSLARYLAAMGDTGLRPVGSYPTHFLLNSELGPLRPLNRLPRLLYAIDRALLAAGFGRDDRHNKLLVARKPAP